MPATRLAPSPTGALHLGNARTFLVNWLLARQNGWRIHLRIEDLDGPRIKRGADRAAIDDLTWLGIDWDDGPVYQSNRQPVYAAAIERLLASGQAYPCICTRKEVELAASAPHAEDGAAVYPGTCRGRFDSIDQARAAVGGREPAIRFRLDAGVVGFDDGFHGRVSIDTAALGDFVIAKSDGTAAYQLAVVIDDADAGITDIDRGDDLLDSTPRQLALYRALGLADRIPRYTHLPLVIGPDGRRLAKRHGDTRLSSYRDAGVPADRLRALLGRWCGIDTGGDGISTSDLLKLFRLDALPRTPIVFGTEDDSFLRARGSTCHPPHR
jgi:glutamyl-tRNA synthetase